MKQERELIHHDIHDIARATGLATDFTNSTFLRFVREFAIKKGILLSNSAALVKWGQMLKDIGQDFRLRSSEQTSGSRRIVITREDICK